MKMRLRLVAFNSCYQGERVWLSWGKYKHTPVTVVSLSKKGVVRWHFGHDFSLRAKVFTSRQPWVKVWRKICD